MQNDTLLSNYVNIHLWEEFCSRFKSDTSRASYESDLIEFCRLTGKDFENASEKDVKQYFEYMKKRAAHGEIAELTVTKKFRELHSFAHFCTEQKDSCVEEDFFYSYLPELAVEKEYVRAITPSEMDRLFEAARDDETAYLIFCLMYRVGLSSKEICDISGIHDFEVRQEGVFILPSGRREYSFVPNDTWELLCSYKDRESNPLFVNSRGRKLNAMFISRLIKKYEMAAGIDMYSARQIAAACFANMFSFGAEKKDVARQKGRTQSRIGRYRLPGYEAKLKKAAGEAVRIRITPP